MNIQSIELKENIIHELSQLPVYIPNVSKTQHVVRCPYCGDSKNPSHGHFSINIDLNDPLRPMLYRCLKCDESGLLTKNILKDLDIYVDSETERALSSYNKKSAKYNRFSNNVNENFFIPNPVPDNLSIEKLNYLNMRLGTNIGIEDAQELKIVLNFPHFIKENGIKFIQGVTLKKVEFIQNNFIGFLSNNNNVITFRNIRNCGKNERYDKVKLNQTNLNPRTFYSIPNSFDLLYNNPIHVHIGEGIFDILSIYYNLNNANKENNLYYAACGFGYMTIVESLLRIGVNTNIILHIYSDNDKTDYDHIKYFNKNKVLMSWIDTIYIHRNQYTNQKDYGVQKEKIINGAYKLK